MFNKLSGFDRIITLDEAHGMFRRHLREARMARLGVITREFGKFCEWLKKTGYRII
jgi:hypothetical protein